MMKSYEKPIVLTNEELAEGVYAASGMCYTTQARFTQSPEQGRGNYVIQFDAVHEAADGHHSGMQRVQVSFNQAVEYISSDGTYISGDNTSTMVVEYDNYHNNGMDTIGLGNLTVNGDPGLAITGVKCIYCNEDCGQH